MEAKTAIITGASTGIGKATAHHFLNKGYQLVLNSANEERLSTAFRDLGESVRVIMVAGDISKPEVQKELVEAAISKFGKIDVLINNAGVFAPKPFLDVEPKDLDRFLNVNLKGTYFLSQLVVKQMLRQAGGSIINIGTVLVDHAIAGFPSTAPVSSKGAIHALTKQLAAEFGKDNIRVNTVAPGIIRSPLQGKIGVENSDDLAGLHLLNRIGETNDVAEILFSLAESSFITGEIVNVDGGHVAGHQFG